MVNFKQAFKQSILALSGLVFTGAANAYGLVFQPEAQVSSIPEPSILALVVVGIIAVGLIRSKLSR